MQWDEKDPSVRPLGRAREVRPWLVLRFRNARFPSLFPLWFQSLFQWWAAAKSFVLPRWSNFIFPAPISYLGDHCVST
jgi:hypothetical protein